MYLGLDLGTSGLRALLADDQGRAVYSAEAALSVQHPFAGWSEQDPDDWISATDKVLGEVMRAHPEALPKVRAIGLSGQMHGAVMLDASDKPVAPCILWNDTRSAVEATQLDAQDGVRDLSGNIVFPGFTAPKLLWMKSQRADLFAEIAKVLLPKDYIRLYLTGRHVSDLSDAAGTSWLDVEARAWSTDLIAAGGMRPEQMPDLVEGSNISGTLRKDITEKFGFAPGTLVAGGGADNAAAACGVGCIAEGQGFVSLGTSGVVLAARDACAPAPDTAVHTFCHAVPGRWYQMGVSLAATDALNWFAKTVGDDAASLANRLTQDPSGPSGAIFLPYLSGERTPHNDAAIRGAFVGLDIAHTREDLTQSVMEGVGFALRDSLEALKATGADLSALLAVGGGTNSPFWLKTLANIFGLPLLRPEEGELGAAQGAIRLAMVADGHSVDDVMSPPKIAADIEPNSTLRADYDAAYAKYRALYPSLKAVLT